MASTTAWRTLTTVADRATPILDALSTVAQLRKARAVNPDLNRRVLSLKDYQARRFSNSYPDLLQAPRYQPATEFFLRELYGPQDFSDRDAQFVKVVPALVRLFPDEVVRTAEHLAKLHALTEQLDSAMASQLSSGTAITRMDYIDAWIACGQPDVRQQQLALTIDIGRSLEKLTRRRTLRHALHLMRHPAKAAGFSALQRFLENGFEAFAQMKGAQTFLTTVEQRELRLANALWHADSTDTQHLPADSPLWQLP